MNVNAVVAKWVLDQFHRAPKGERFLTLAAIVRSDITFGPFSSKDVREQLNFRGYKGWESATKELRAFLEEHVPREVWVDTVVGEVVTALPEVELCPTCDGSGDLSAEGDEPIECERCEGSGKVSPNLEDYLHVEDTWAVYPGRDITEHM